MGRHTACVCTYMTRSLAKGQEKGLINMFIPIKSTIVLKLLQADCVPAWLYAYVGGASKQGEVCCLSTGAKITLSSEGQYGIYGYAYDGCDLAPYADLLPLWCVYDVHGRMRAAYLTKQEAEAHMWDNETVEG
jgi:hypothetical protein